MRPRAQAETAAFHAARARTAATLAFNKLPYQTRQQLGTAPPTTEALQEAILQRTRLAAIPLPRGASHSATTRAGHAAAAWPAAAAAAAAAAARASTGGASWHSCAAACSLRV